jgi:hypothetical protein
MEIKASMMHENDPNAPLPPFGYWMSLFEEQALLSEFLIKYPTPHATYGSYLDRGYGYSF